MSSISVSLGARSYDIHAGPGLLEQAGPLIRPLLDAPRLFVVTDENVAARHLDRLKDGLEAAGIENHGVVLPAGEGTKDFLHLESLLAAMLEAGCERATTIVAFGGGVIGDLTGFAASILLRGVPFIQIPTTLLSQVDSSVGGKTGINMPQGKNLVGSFYQPRLVLADIDVLETLSRRELVSGYAEVIKYGLLGDADFFTWLESGNGQALFDGDKAVRQQAVLRCCAAKAAIVAADERESGVRAHLNLGHTFAHVLEAESGFGDRLTHGEAVSIGLVMAFDLSCRMGLCPKEDLARLERHFKALGMPVAPPALPDRSWDADALMRRLPSDKKVKDGRVAFILARGIGSVLSTRDVPEDLVRSVIADHLEPA